VKSQHSFPNHHVRIEEAVVVDELVLGLENLGREKQSTDMFSIDMEDVDEQATTVALDDENTDVESLNAFMPVEDDCDSGMSPATTIRRLLSKELFGLKLTLLVIYLRFASSMSLRKTMLPLGAC
jgi:hypothetical protein